MSKVEKEETGITIGAKLDTDTNVLGTVKIEDSVVTWEALDETYVDLGQDILKQQLLTVEMAKAYSEVIGTDKELSMAVLGLTKLLGDLASEAVAIRAKHTGIGVGQIAQDDENNITLYIQCEFEYSSIAEKFLNITTTATLDIFTRLGIGGEEIKQLKAMNNTLKKV